MKKVYCKNCKHYRKVKAWMFGTDYEECNASENLELSGNYYSEFVEHTLCPETINSDNSCKGYKRKWWKFWVKGNKRKELKGCQPKTDPGAKPDTRFVRYIELGSPKRRKKEKTKLISADFIKGYLDGCIMKWRKELGISRTMEDILVAECYIDTYQSVRISLLGELLLKEGK